MGIDKLSFFFPPRMKISREQILYFRCQRQFLLPSCRGTISEICSSILGIQAQVQSAALVAVALRCHRPPNNTCTSSMVHDATQPQTEPKDFMPILVKCWGQRGTLHLYERSDWNKIIQARLLWSRERKNLPINEELLKNASNVFTSLGEPTEATSILHLLPKEFIERCHTQLKATKVKSKPESFASQKTIHKLSLRGDICHATRKKKQLYVSRAAWFPTLPWNEINDYAPDHEEVINLHQNLIKRYLGAFGPATARDAAHYFGSTLTNTRRWFTGLQEKCEITVIVCIDRIFDAKKGSGSSDDLFLLVEDVAQLSSCNPPLNDAEWPISFLSLYDTILMGYADKSWMVPEPSDRKEIWKKAAYVASSVLYRGIIIATYTHTILKSTSTVQIQILKLSKWNEEIHPALLIPEANRFANILGCKNVKLTY